MGGGGVGARETRDGTDILGCGGVGGGGREKG